MDFGKKIVLSYNELYQFEFPLNERFELQVNHENVKYEFLIKIADKKENLICFGTGATDRGKFPPPYYSRHSWFPKFEESIIIYNDPTLYLDDELRLGWGVGKNEVWYLQVIAHIIRIITIKNNILLENTIFFGTSGAGFMSMILASILKKSTAIVNNPQVNIETWHIFDKMISVCFDELDLDSILELYGYRFDVIKYFKKENYVPPITYIVNMGEKKDIINHLLPFIEGLKTFNMNKQVNIVLYYNDEGHNGILSPKEVTKLIKNHFNQKTKNKENNDHPFKYENISYFIEGLPQFKNISNMNILLYQNDESPNGILSPEQTIELMKKYLNQRHVGEIIKDRVIKQNIIIPKDLDASKNERVNIEILMATFNRKNTSKLEICLEQGNTIENVQINTLKIKENRYNRIIFKSTSFKKGLSLLTIKGIDGEKGNAVTIYLTYDSKWGCAIIDGKRSSESLAVKSYIT